MDEALEDDDVSPTYVVTTCSCYDTNFLYVEINFWYDDSPYTFFDDDSPQDPSYIATFISYDTSSDDLSKAFSNEDYLNVSKLFYSSLIN